MMGVRIDESEVRHQCLYLANDIGLAVTSNEFSMSLKTVFSLGFSCERMNFLASISFLGGSFFWRRLRYLAETVGRKKQGMACSTKET